MYIIIHKLYIIKSVHFVLSHRSRPLLLPVLPRHRLHVLPHRLPHVRHRRRLLLLQDPRLPRAGGARLQGEPTPRTAAGTISGGKQQVARAGREWHKQQQEYQTRHHQRFRVRPAV